MAGVKRDAIFEGASDIPRSSMWEGDRVGEDLKWLISKLLIKVSETRLLVLL